MSEPLVQMLRESTGISKATAKAAQDLRARKLDSDEPLYNLVARCSFPSTDLRLLGSGTGGTCFALQTNLYPGLTECAVKICFQGDRGFWETMEEARVYKLLSSLQGSCLPTILDYVQCELICPYRRYNQYLEACEDGDTDWNPETDANFGRPIRARILVMKEVGICCRNLSSSDTEQYLTDLTPKLARILSIGPDLRDCWYAQRLQDRNIILYNGTPLLIDLGKWYIAPHACKPWDDPTEAAAVIEKMCKQQVDWIRQRKMERLEEQNSSQERDQQIRHRL